MKISLVVVRAFGAHLVGDVISEAEHVWHVLRGEYGDHVVKVAAPPAPPLVETPATEA